MNLTSKEKDKLYDELERLANKMMEFGLDSIVILTTTGEGDGGTAFNQISKGNAFAARESARSWLGRCDLNRLVDALRGDDDDGGEEWCNV